MNISVVDYGAGNLRSVETALRHLGAEFSITNDPKLVSDCDKLIIPGVGDAKAAMERLDSGGLSDAIREFHLSERPLLGICLGSQIVLESSEEGEAACLALVRGRAKRFPKDMGLKVPHMGWNTIRIAHRHPILEGVPEGASFYFVHSFYPEPAAESAALTATDYGLTFASSLAEGNVTAFQFHPEKSGRHGLRILENFVAQL